MRWIFNTALMVALSLLLPLSARAFSDPHAYADAVDVGGGAGRWFTGSSADGYGCDVCHTGAVGADIAVSGLPLNGFSPGMSYEISVSWPVQIQHLALMAEFTDEQRHGAGALALPRPDALKPTELCGAELPGQVAAELHQADGGRNLVSVIDCGARALRFLWTAPPSAAGPLWFDLGFVTSNQDATPAGDGVTLVRRPLPAAGQALATRAVAHGCSASPGRTRGSMLSCLLLLGIGWCGHRRRAREAKS
jgi:hypothetical protein